jgi:hypothetical protein
VTDPFVAADWTLGAPNTKAVVSGALRFTNPTLTNTQTASYDPLGNSVEDVFIQAVLSAVTNGPSVGIAARFATYSNPARLHTALGAALATAALFERRPAGTTQQDTDAFAALTLPQRISMAVEGTAAASYIHGAGAVQALTSLTVATGFTGVYFNSGLIYTATFSFWAAMRSRWVIVNDLPTGWDAQILDAADTALATAVEVGGVATLDTLTLQFPNPRKIRIRDEFGATIDTFPITGGVWGGDEYDFLNTPPVPDEPVVTDQLPFGLTIGWDTILEADEYVLERSLDGVTGWTQVFEGSFNSYEDADLAPLTEYFYRVAACNENGCSAWSDVGSGTTLAPPEPPGARRGYRFRIRDASTQADPNGTTDVLVVTSLRDGINPYIAEPPEGDGQEIDLLTGGVRTGTYAVRVLDAPTGDSMGYGYEYGGVVRYVTNRLEDAEFRQQLLSRRAYIEVTEDGGDTWIVLQAGYVINVKLASAISYVFSIGDTRRIETQRRAFTWSATPGPTGISERDVFPARGCLVGGPIVGGFGPVPDTGGDEFLITATPELDPVTGRMLVPLTCLAAFLPPEYRRVRASTGSTGQASGNFSPSSISTWYAKVLQPYERSFTGLTGVTSPFIQSLLDWRYTWYPDLEVQFTDGTTTWRGYLRAAVLAQGGTFFVAALDAAGTASPPTAGDTIYRARVIKPEVSEDSPVYADLHPVDLVTALFDTVGIEWDPTTAAVVKAALGEDLRYAIRVTKPVMMLDFLTKSVFGPFGFSIRNNEVGAQEFYTTRLLTDVAPTINISTDSLRSMDPPIFDLDEGQIVSGFKMEYETFARSTLLPNASPPPPPDGIVTAKAEIIVQNGDLSVFSTREVGYVFAGFAHLAGGWADAMPLLISSIATLGFDRYGRGAPSVEVSVLATDEAYNAKLGDEVYLSAAHYPNRGFRIGESDVGARIAQVVRRTIRPYGADLKLVDSGLALQPVTPPATISLAGSAAAPRTIAEFTIGNAATINAGAVLFVAVQWAISPTTPAGDGSIFARYAPGSVPVAAVPLPPVVPGSRVWVRARTEQSGRRPSAWTSWDDVTLGAFSAPSGVAISGITAESFVVAWTNADPSYYTEVFVAPGSVAPSDWAPFRVARFLPGSDRATLRGLTPAAAYIVGVAHVDPGTGELTAVVTDTDSTTANSLTAPSPIALTIIQTQADAGQPVGIGLGLWAFDESYDLEIQRAPDSAGIPGTWETIANVGGTTQVYRDFLPSDGVTRWYRCRHTLPGFDPSPWSGAQSGVPSACPEDLSRPELAPLISTSLVDLGGGSYEISFFGVGDIEYRVDGGAWTSPGTSPLAIAGTALEQVVEFRAVLNGITVTSTEIIPANPLPVLSGFSAAEIQAIGCGVDWIVEPSWLCSPTNDADYKIVLRNYDTTAVLNGDFSTAAGSYVDNTGEVGDPAFTGTFHTRRYILQLVRLSDSAVVQSLDSNRVDVETGPAC